MKTHTDKSWPRDFAKVVEDMCCNSIQYEKEIRIEGVLAITLDDSEVVVINVNRQTKGSNGECVVPRYTTAPEPTDTVTPMLSRLFSDVSCVSSQSPYVAVTGLGSSNLVGQLVITNSPDGKVPQAKLILNEHNLPVTSSSQKSKVVSPKTSSEIITDSTPNDSPVGNFNTNNSVTGSSVPNITKKSLDSVIAKLHHQTSATCKPKTDKRQPLEPTIVRRVAPPTKGETREKVNNRNDKNGNAASVMRKVKEMEDSKVKDVSLSRKSKDKKDTTVKVPTVTRKVKDTEDTQANVASLTGKVKDTEVQEDSVQPPVKRQRVDSNRLSVIKKEPEMSGTVNGKRTDSNKSMASNTPAHDTVSSVSGRNTPTTELTMHRAKSTPTRETPQRQAKIQSNKECTDQAVEKITERHIINKTTGAPKSKPAEKRVSVRAKKPKEIFAPDDAPNTTYMTEKLMKPGVRLTRQRKVVSSKLAQRKTSAQQSQAKKIVKKHQNRQQKAMHSTRSRQTGSSNSSLSNQATRKKQVASKKSAGLLRLKNMCNKCVNCKRTDDCETCTYCLDKKKFGGKNTLRQKCINKQCIRLSRVRHRLLQKKE